MNRYATVGVVAGLGPAAGTAFYRSLVSQTPAHGDGEHVPVVLIADPTTPSRMAHLNRAGPCPVPHLRRTISRLVRIGADLIVIPSLTTHHYYTELVSDCPAPILDFRYVIVDSLLAQRYGRVLVLATSGTARSHLLDRVGRTMGRLVLQYPSQEVQTGVDEAIDLVKRAEYTLALEKLAAALNGCSPDHLDCIIVACTDLSVLSDAIQTLAGKCSVVDSVELLAAATIEAARRPSAKRGEGPRWSARTLR